MADSTAQQPVFDFMVVRPPVTPADDVLRRNYVRDDAYVAADKQQVRRVERDLHSEASTSEVGKFVHQRVFCNPASDDDSDETRIGELVEAVFGLLPVCARPCEAGGVGKRGAVKEPFPLEQLERWTWVEGPSGPVILPDRLERHPDVPLIGHLSAVLAAVDTELGQEKPDIARIVTRIEQILGAGLHGTVFAANGGHTTGFTKAKERLFDTLYVLYVLRRAHDDISFEHIVEGLRTLHVLEALALDSLRARALAKTRLTAAERALLTVSGTTIPLTPATLRELRICTPVVHRIFGELFYFKKPFNPIREIGVGDLKVVRQRLVAYRPGEISHIHNVLKGESKTRDHKRTESSEDTFSFTETTDEETTRDVQTTQRFELKTEAENVVRATLGVNANANVTYQSTPVVASVSAGFSYNRSTEDTAKTAHNFARDVIDKAVSRVQEQATIARSTVRRTSTEEHNQQVFNNIKGENHVSGIYRWIDKVYEAQVYTYGRRLMYEFLIPQPAAFWADSVLRSFSSRLRVPQPPLKPEYETVENPGGLAGPQDVLEASYKRLRVDYDLDELPPPVETKSVALRNKTDGGRRFAEKDLSGAEHYHAFDASGEGLAGYRVTAVHVNGFCNFHHKDAKNGLDLEIGGKLVLAKLLEADPPAKEWAPDWDEPPIEAIEFASDDTAVQLRFHQEIWYYELAVVIDLQVTEAVRGPWQTAVFKVVKEAEERKVKAANAEKRARYERELAEYHDRIAELKATAIDELLAGTSEAGNKALMDEEIKKHCLSMITKEFDAVRSDDVLSDITTTGTRTVKPVWTRFEVTEKDDFSRPTTAGFVIGPDKQEPEVEWPAIDIPESRRKGRTVQFLEQAFEWEHLSYLFYPYFWAEEPRWIELMHRRDDADATFTAFLRAGMARVLVAVSPGYDCAVMTYLKCRTPWGIGAGQPAIGDPLFVPLYEEVRAQTDDRLGGEPDGEPWRFTVPTTLVYLHGSGDPLPDLEKER